MVVNNKTSITSDEAFELLNRSAKREYIKKYYFVIFLVVAGIPILTLGLIKKDNIYTIFGSAILAIAVAYIIYNTIYMKKIPKVVKEKNYEVCTSGVTYEYKFKEHSVILNAKSGFKNSKYEYSYTTLKKIYEYENRYELKFQNNVTIYVDKSGFENKRMEEFFRHNIELSKKKIITKK